MHHRQFLQSIHSLHSADKEYSQSILDSIMTGVKSFILTTKRERVQRWLVNQRNAKKTLEMLAKKTADGSCALLLWAMHWATRAAVHGRDELGKR